MSDNHLLAKILDQTTRTHGEVCKMKETVDWIVKQQDDIIIALRGHDDRLGSLERFRARLKGGAAVASFFSAAAYVILQKWETVKGWIS